jgi:hypothetical protein
MQCALFRTEKQALRQTNLELMERLKKLWNCYKEKSLERLCNSMSSNSSTTSASFKNNLKVCPFSNCVMFFSIPFLIALLTAF